MTRKHLFFFLGLLCISSLQAQFQFTGEVSTEFINSTAYLTVIDDYKKGAVFLTDKIIQESEIDSLGNFIFKGDFLSDKNKFYKIYIDKCNENITDYNHLLNHCDDSSSTIFIANNTDEIHFPLNRFEQMFCSLEFTSSQNNAIYKIDSIQEILLAHLQESKSDEQRKIIYNTYFKELQSFSQSLNEPLAELYSYHLYSDDASFSREFYLNDLKSSDYYTGLLERLNENYPNSSYTIQFENDLTEDNVKTTNKTYTFVIGILGFLLVLSLVANFYFLKKKRKKKSLIDYKTALSPQEQKVFELMHEKLANKEIADSLFISLSTVKTHINNIYSKLSISSRSEIERFF